MNPYHKTFIIATILLGWFLSAQPIAVGQVERLELGRRLQRFEMGWETATKEQQAISSRPMQSAVSSFFSLQLKNAAQKLDEAWLLVRDRPTTDWQRSLISYYLAIDPLIVDTEETSLSATLRSLYKPQAELGNDYRVKLELMDEREQIVKTHESTTVLLIDGIQISLNELTEGDYRLRATIYDGPDSFQLIEVGVSLIHDIQSRIDRLLEIATDREKPLSDSVRATLRSHLDLIRQLSEGSSQEIDYPAARLLTFAERLAAQPQQAASIIQDQAIQHDTWLTLRQNRRQVPVRLRAPTSFKATAIPDQSQPSNLADAKENEIATVQQSNGEAAGLPLLILLHGAGGSENMFFETYGAGRAVQLGLDRGWLVVAPRQGSVAGMGGLAFDVPDIVDSLAEFFPIDRSQIFLMGHSMGAGQAIRQVSQHPKIPAAVAAIGGGSAIGDATGVAHLPWFVAAGELDFGLSGARALKNSLEKAGTTKLQYKVYPNIEHMVIVQACLDDAFAFFDQWQKPN